jgi:hypothetical protein
VLLHAPAQPSKLGWYLGAVACAVVALVVVVMRVMT